MSYINNMNPRRMIWFNQNAPKNKMDLWLSYNRHYEDTSEDETVDPQLVDDNPNQRKCDLILKAWDCGKWIPVVGFNTTAANKIDTVTGVDYTIDGVTHSGKNVYHPAIFTAESPNELYDAGTLGSLLSDPNFVTELEWYNVFNSSNYDWGDIFGDTNWFSDLTWSIIQGGSSTYHLPWATTTQCGGILSDTHTYDTLSVFKPIEVKFYPTTSAYSSKLHRLCVSASDVIEQINGYYNDNPGGSSININWNSTTIHQLAEVLLDIFKNSSSLGFNATYAFDSDPHIYPYIWGVSSTNAGKFLRINPTWNPEGTGWSQSNNNMDWVDLGEIIPDLVNDEDIFVPKDGINISYVAPHGDDRQYIEWGLNHIEDATDGQFCRKTTNNGEADIEWVAIVDNGDNTITIDTVDPRELSISATNKIKTFVPDTNGNVLISTAITTESSGNYRFIEHCAYRPLENGLIMSTLHNLTLLRSNYWVVNESYVRFRTSSDSKPMLYFDAGVKYIPSFSTSELIAVYDSTEGINYIQLEEDTDYSVEIMYDWIKLEKITSVYTPNN